MQTSSSFTPHGESAPIIRWSAVSAGVVVSLGVLATLYALGVSTGLAAFDVHTSGSPRHVGIFIGAFGAVAPFVALFAGGFVAGRGAGATRKSVGFLQGLTVWGISAIALLWLSYGIISAAVGGAVAVGQGVAQVGKTVVQAGGSALAEGVDGLSNLQSLAEDAKRQVQKHVRLDADTILDPVNARLKKAGRKALTSDQIERAAKRIAKTAVQEKKIDRDSVIEAVTHETSISKSDAELVADVIVDKFNEAKAELDAQLEEGKEKLEAARREATERVEKATNQAADATSKAFGGLFVALLLGLVAAGSGATLATKEAIG